MSGHFKIHLKKFLLKLILTLCPHLFYQRLLFLPAYRPDRQDYLHTNSTRRNSPICRNGNWYGTTAPAKDFLLTSAQTATEIGSPRIRTVSAAKTAWHIPSVTLIRHSCFPVRPTECRILFSRFRDIWLESVVLIIIFIIVLFFHNFTLFR